MVEGVEQGGCKADAIASVRLGVGANCRRSVKAQVRVVGRSV